MKGASGKEKRIFEREKTKEIRKGGNYSKASCILKGTAAQFWYRHWKEEMLVCLGLTTGCKKNNQLLCRIEPSVVVKVKYSSGEHHV